MNKFLYIFFLFLSFTFFSQEKDNIKTHTYATNNTPPTPEKLAFEATKLTASNSQNKKRIAKEGETLYYVNSEKKPKTDISLTI
ncbi:hypothetical protein NTJ28_002536, partial [Flavobacterium psychrophilum]|nr:hypothetical protein [Flavobacterium psychrophilum]EKT4510254.1 hypothetical protein [Flavobacterium psychrophilum]